MKPMNWEEICDLISLSANSAHALTLAGGTEADGLRSEMQFLENIASYCANEAKNVEMMLDDHMVETETSKS